MNEEKLYLWALTLLRQHAGPFTIYPNPMRSDGVFVGQDKPIEPYEGVRGIDGPLYPATPLHAYALPCQVPQKVAARLLTELNRLNGEDV